MIHENNKKILSKLLADYQALSLTEKLFYAGELNEALERFAVDDSSANAFAVCRTYLNNPWISRSWFFTSPFAFFLESSFIAALRQINSAGLLTDSTAQDHFDALAACPNPLEAALDIRNTTRAHAVRFFAPATNDNERYHRPSLRRRVIYTLPTP